MEVSASVKRRHEQLDKQGKNTILEGVEPGTRAAAKSKVKGRQNPKLQT